MLLKSVIYQILSTIETFLNTGDIFGDGKDNPLLPTSATTCGVVPIFCQESKYRSYDGSCNNLQFGYWGTPNSTYTRILPNSYSDGISAFPKSVTGDNLPNPRFISLNTYVDIPKADLLWRVIFMQFGQILAHDLSLTAGVSQTKKDIVMCCSKGQLTEEAKTNRRCAAISIPRNDPYNSPQGIKCMNFFRTLNTHDAEKCIGVTNVAEQLTAVTAFLDASFMYGSDEVVAKAVRAFKGGQLAFVQRHGRDVLPQNPEAKLVCNVKDNTEPCYMAGDVRVNQNPQLALLHNLYMLLHNNVAQALEKVNPHWTDETLFQETRRIIIAMHQHITYYEFLPPLLGMQNMLENKLIHPLEKGYVRDYDPNVNPGILNEAATAALRVFHTEIVGIIELITEQRNVTNQIRLRDWYNKPSVCEHANNFNELTIGLATQQQDAVDRFITTDVTNFLFRDGLLGVDLKAIDIWRCRDHGLGKYAQALKTFGLGDPKSFDDYEKFIKPENVNILRRIYSSYQDVDLVVGCSLEKPTELSLSGAVTQKILIEQFKRTRFGDYYFYENGHGKGAFTKRQLNEIRKSSIARVLCSNPDIKHMQRDAFLQLSFVNPLANCVDIPDFNPEAWREKYVWD